MRLAPFSLIIKYSHEGRSYPKKVIAWPFMKTFFYVYLCTEGENLHEIMTTEQRCASLSLSAYRVVPFAHGAKLG